MQKNIVNILKKIFNKDATIFLVNIVISISLLVFMYFLSSWVYSPGFKEYTSNTRRYFIVTNKIDNKNGYYYFLAKECGKTNKYKFDVNTVVYYDKNVGDTIHYDISQKELDNTINNYCDIRGKCDPKAGLFIIATLLTFLLLGLSPCPYVYTIPLLYSLITGIYYVTL